MKTFNNIIIISNNNNKNDNKTSYEAGKTVWTAAKPRHVCHRLIPATNLLRSNTPDYPSINLQRPPNNSHMTASK